MKKERRRKGQQRNDECKQHKQIKNQANKELEAQTKGKKARQRGLHAPGPEEQPGQEGWGRAEWVPARPHPSPAEPGCAGGGGQCSRPMVGWYYRFEVVESLVRLANEEYLQ